MTCVYKFDFGFRRMHQKNIGIAVLGDFKCLAGTYGYPLEVDSCFLFKNGIDTFGFTCYSADADVMSLSSTARTLGADSEEGKVIAYRSAVIEVYGLGMDYFPKVRVRCTGRPGGPKTLRRITFEVKVFGGFGIPSGSRWFGWE